MNSVKANEEDEAKIQKVQMGMAMSNPAMGAGVLVDAQADAMKIAAANEGGMGAAFGFMGMNMAGAAGGMNTGNLYGMAQQQQQQAPVQSAPPPVAPPAAPQAPAGRTCECGQSGRTRSSAAIAVRRSRNPRTGPVNAGLIIPVNSVETVVNRNRLRRTGPVNAGLIMPAVNSAVIVVNQDLEL